MGDFKQIKTIKVTFNVGFCENMKNDKPQYCLIHVKILT
jgi:hypothetical protein